MPIHKSGPKTNLENYRPISLLPVFSKVYEKCMKSRLCRFLEKYSIINSNQFGFQSGKNTSDAILNHLKYTYDSLDDRMHTISVFIDYRKAFDTINHKILLDKLFHYGIRGIPLAWFQDYLTNRTQQTKIGKISSTKRPLNIGVPQGSVLGPILFILYINDLPKLSNNLHVTLFADDTTISLSDLNYSDLMRRMNLELRKLKDWTISNRLSLNVKKTSAMIVTCRKIPDINDDLHIGDERVQFCKSTKFLGLTIDNKLNFRDHIDQTCSKISRSIGIIHRLSSLAPPSALRMLYFTLVYPYLIYANVAWGGTFTTNLTPLVTLNKKVVRILCGESHRSHTNPLFKKTNILKIQCLHKFLLAQYIYKHPHIVSLASHSHNTRQRLFAVPVSSHRLDITRRSPHFNGLMLWNSLPQLVRSSPSLSIFKSRLKSHLISFYDE